MASCLGLGHGADEMVSGIRRVIRIDKTAAIIGKTVVYGNGTVQAEMISIDNEKVIGKSFECARCHAKTGIEELHSNLFKCPECGKYFRMPAEARLSSVIDREGFLPVGEDIIGGNPIGFEGYEDKLALAREGGASEAVVCGFASIQGEACAVAAMEPGFLMGSMGYAVGQRIARLFDDASERSLPVIIFCASGGARMQEGLVSLAQMANVSCAVRRHHDRGLLFLSVLTDPTTGGVMASFATEGDIILAEPGMTAGFAGKRVIESTIRRELPQDFQTAEFALEHGLIDGIVAREDMRAVISELLSLHRVADLQVSSSIAGSRTGRRSIDFLQRGRKAHDDRFGGGLRSSGELETISTVVERESRYAPAQAPAIATADVGGSGGLEGGSDAWESVQLARRTDRPTAQAYREGLIDGFLQMHGDRCFADDPAIIAGLGFIDGRPVTIITQEKGVDTKSRVAHHFGCSHPEGYRKAARLARQAEHFGRPVVCLIDTQGAHCDAESEERGQGNAIAECLTTFATLRVPVVSVVLSEGGSGGALALAVADRIAMLEHAVFSILSPEGFASILWKDVTLAPQAAAAMRPTAADALALGVIDDIIPECGEGAHENVQEAVMAVREYVSNQLDALCEMPIDQLVEERQARFARVGSLDFSDGVR